MMARRDDAPWKPSNLAKAAKIGNVVERITHPIARRVYKRGFPYLPPTVPMGVEVPEDARLSERTTTPIGPAGPWRPPCDEASSRGRCD